MEVMLQLGWGMSRYALSISRHHATLLQVRNSIMEDSKKVKLGLFTEVTGPVGVPGLTFYHALF